MEEIFFERKIQYLSLAIEAEKLILLTTLEPWKQFILPRLKHNQIIFPHSSPLLPPPSNNFICHSASYYKFPSSSSSQGCGILVDNDDDDDDDDGMDNDD